MKITNCRFLKLFRINAIVLYPFVLYQSKTPDEKLMKHEAIHLRQIKDIGVMKFYFYYLREYFEGRRSGLSHYEAYRNISFEKEAFDS
jgi:hypothetical protein